MSRVPQLATGAALMGALIALDNSRRFATSSEGWKFEIRCAKKLLEDYLLTFDEELFVMPETNVYQICDDFLYMRGRVRRA